MVHFEKFPFAFICAVCPVRICIHFKKCLRFKQLIRVPIACRYQLTQLARKWTMKKDVHPRKTKLDNHKKQPCDVQYLLLNMVIFSNVNVRFQGVFPNVFC